MVIWGAFVYGVPALIAALVGWTRGKAPPETPREAVREIGIVLLWAFGWITLYLFAMVGILSSGFELRWPAILLAQTAIYWVPVAVIAYIIRAQKERAT